MSLTNEELVVFPTVARIATPTPVENQNYNGRGAIIIVDVASITDTPSVVFNVEGKDPAGGDWYLIVASAAIVAAGVTVLRIYPGLTPIANLTVSDLLPQTWRVRPVHADADSITYTVGAILML